MTAAVVNELPRYETSSSERPPMGHHSWTCVSD